jgi:2-polyprenyl-3-methyl-5-hydroxy-6-metoxy-1,4-benzoquinol methylase
MNNFLQFYGNHRISPVSQNIDDLELHFSRRIVLYRTLGLAASLFKNRDVLEIAPGSGHNSIVTATFGAKSYDLVEPNLAGFDKMVSLFGEHQVRNNAIQFFNVRLEDFPEEKNYDIVLCEGLIPGLSNQDTFLQLLAGKVRSGGILVVTCADAVSAFFESLRRYLARILVSRSDIDLCAEGGAKQVARMLSETFHSHLCSLKGMSRPVEDWVWDNLLNPAAASLAASNEFSVERCLKVLGDRFYFYGANPIFMDNWTWYKDLPRHPRDYNEPFVKCFTSQRHNFLHYQETSLVDSTASEKIYRCCKTFALHVEEKDPLALGDFTSESIRKDLIPVSEVREIVGKCGLRRSEAAISEFAELFDEGKVPTSQIISNMRVFCGAFGRGQQYVSLVKV